jgi:hypothetical protein
MLSSDAGPGRCAAPAAGGALQLAFPCEANSDTQKHLSGPALNLWASLTAPATDAQAATCAITTLSPSLYYKRVPPALYYGYSVDKLPCRQLAGGAVSAAAEALSLGSAMTASSESRMGVSYGIWLVPSLPSVSNRTP